MDRRLLDYRPEFDAFETASAAPSAAGELQQAAELLERLEDGELERYLMGLLARSRPALAPPVAEALLGLLGQAAARVWRPAGALRGPAAGPLFGLELEGLSHEDQAFELARHFIRYATDAARRAGQATGSGSPQAVARRAAATAAQHHAPGLLPTPGSGAGNTGLLVPQGASSHRPQSLAPSCAKQAGASHHRRRFVMHDIDRTQLEYGSETSGFEAEQFEFAEGEWGFEASGTLSEADEYELASELLGVTSEEELDQFLGNLIKKVGRGAGKLIRSPIGQAVGGVLKGVAKKALPLAGGALGGFVGGPLGAKIGSGLASAAGSALGLEGEAMAQEDQEFEGAKQFVRMAANTVNKAASAPTSADPRAVAQSAAVSAVKQLVPGLLKRAGAGGMVGAGSRGPAGSGGSGGGGSGRWARQGNRIVLYGA